MAQYKFRIITIIIIIIIDDTYRNGHILVLDDTCRSQYSRKRKSRFFSAVQKSRREKKS